MSLEGLFQNEIVETGGSSYFFFFFYILYYFFLSAGLLQAVSFLESIHAAVGELFSYFSYFLLDKFLIFIVFIVFYCLFNCELIYLGLVPTGVLVSLMQWGGRTHFLLAIVRQIPEVIF